jgi:tetratricopeptide (TPR) repeat protein
LAPVLAVLATALALAPAPARAAAGEAQGWVEVHTPSFTLVTNAAPERGAAIALDLERFRAVFARLAPELTAPPPVPTRILAFRDADAYAPYKSRRDGGGVRTLGQFLARPDGNFMTLDADPEEPAALGVVYHEYVHELVRQHFPRVPLWFNEGLAEYYRTFAVEGGRAVIGRPPENRLRWLARRAVLDLDEVLAASGERHGSDGAEEVGRLYSVSWLLVHYLLSGDPERLDRAADYLARLAEGEGSLAAFERAFGVRATSLEAQLVAYVRRGDLPVAAFPLAGLPSAEAVTVAALPPEEVHVQLGDLATALGRRETAQRHFLAALELAPTHPGALAGLAYLQDLQGSLDEARLLYRDALAANPSDALPWLRYGRHLLGRLAAGAPPEEAAELAETAREVLARAVVLEPHFAEARALLGRAYLFGGADPAHGVAHLERARRALPLRMDLAADEIQLLVRAGRFGRARALVEGVLARWAEPELVARAEEEIERGELIHAANRALEAGDGEEAVRLLDEAVSRTSDPELGAHLEAQLEALRRQVGGW